MENQKTNLIKTAPVGVVCIHKIVVTNYNLSGLARALFTILFMLADFAQREKIKIGKKIIHESFFKKDSYRSLMKAWKELVDCGYLTEHRIKLKNGKFVGWRYSIHPPGPTFNDKEDEKKNNE
jgi:hypothetical protein